MRSPGPATSTLAAHHPDHPTLADLGVKMDTLAKRETDEEGNSITSGGSPVQTATPTSMSDIDPSSPPSSLHSGMPKRPGALSEGPNARSKSVTVADGMDTFGALNCHPKASSPIKSRNQSVGSFRIGVSEDKNKRCRRTMEDAHSFVYDFAGVKGQGYFAVFDGHAGKVAAEWSGQNFHEYFLDALYTYPDQPVPDLLNRTFHVVDSRLSQMAIAGKTQSGCTAVTAFLRLEHDASPNDPEFQKGFLNPEIKPRGLIEGKGEEELEEPPARRPSMGGGTSGHVGGAASETSSAPSTGASGLGRKSSGRRIRDFMKGLTGGSDKEKGEEEDAPDSNDILQAVPEGSRVEAMEPRSEKGLKRVLYTANVGDARAVLCRGGKAVRLTYDHKGSDTQEAKRITDAGGFVMNSRVNGVLAVTRSLGDASMKEFVVGSPYTTETALDENDEFLIVACDGLWDVTEDQDAVELVRSVQDPQEASKRLLDHAMTNYSTDNLSVMVIRFYN